MKKLLTIIYFQVGVDVLGFPLFTRHHKEDVVIIDSQYFKAYSKVC